MLKKNKRKTWGCSPNIEYVFVFFFPLEMVNSGLDLFQRSGADELSGIRG